MTNDNSNSNKVHDMDKIDLIDQLTAKTSQLTAMLTMVSGSGFEGFNGYNDTIKQNYLWACADIANGIKTLTDNAALNT